LKQGGLEHEQLVEKESVVLMELFVAAEHLAQLEHFEPDSDSVALLVGVAVSVPASVFASRDCDGWPLLQAHRQDNERPCIDDNDSIHTENSHSAVLNTFGLCTRQYASIISSFRHNVA